MADGTMRATRPGSSGRRPKREVDARTCAAKGCDVRLSTYNVRTHCYRHWPTRYPRLRGTFEDAAGR